MISTRSRPAITRFELSAGSYTLPTPAIEEVCASVSQTLSRFHTTQVPDHGTCTVLHHFWVERRTCQTCGDTFELHPHYQLAYSTDPGRQWVFCQRCHQVAALSLRRHVLACACGARTRLRHGTVRKGTVRCPGCGVASALSSRTYYAEAPPTVVTYLRRNTSSGPLQGSAGTLRRPPLRIVSAMTRPRVRSAPWRPLRVPLRRRADSGRRAVRISDRSSTASRATASCLMRGNSCI